MAHTEVIVVPETGLVKADFSAVIYDSAGVVVADPGFTVVETSDRHYTFAGLPDGSTADPQTLTYRTPSVVGAKRWPTITSPPDAFVVALGVTGEAGTLETTLYRDGVEYAASLTITEPGSIGDYKLTGIPDLSGAWKLVVQSSLSIVEVDYAGQDADGVLVTVADLRSWLGQEFTTADDTLLVAAEARAVSWLKRQTRVPTLSTDVISPILDGPGGHGPLDLPCAITAVDGEGNPRLTSLDYRGSIGDAWTEIDLDDVEIVEHVDLVTHVLYLRSGSWPTGPMLVRPTYLTGYQATGEPATPHELALAVVEVVSQHFFGSRQATKREALSFQDRFDRLVDPVIRSYTNPHKGKTLLLRAVI